MVRSRTRKTRSSGSGSGSRWYFDEHEADRVCRFFGKYLRHFEGEWAGKRFILEEWQRDFLRRLFGWRDRKTGARRYRVAYLEVPRKNGKSTLAAGIALYLLISDQEPGAQVYSLAADATQAKIVFDVAKAMVEESPALRRIARPLRNSIVVKSTRSSYKVISSDLKGKWGFNAHGIIGDEIHALPGRKVWDALLTSRGARRQPLVLAITTAGIYDKTSLCWELHDRAVRVNDPKSGYRNDRFLGLVYGAKRGDRWKSKAVWRKANPNLGVTVSMEFLEEEYQKALDSPAFQNTFRRMYLDEWTSQATRAVDMDLWDLGDHEYAWQKLRYRPCWAGLDLSATQDLTSCVLAFEPFEEDGPIPILSYFWMPGDAIARRAKDSDLPFEWWAENGYLISAPGPDIDYPDVMKFIEWLADTFDLQSVAYDRWGAKMMIQLLEDSGLEMVMFGQGYASMSPAVKETFRLLRAGRIWHGGNPVLRWNADNLVLRQDPAGCLKPDKERSTEKIDGMVALFMAVEGLSRELGMLGGSGGVAPVG